MTDGLQYGLVPAGTQVGDSVAIVFGSCVPFVLHLRHLDMWELVESCFFRHITGEGGEFVMLMLPRNDFHLELAVRFALANFRVDWPIFGKEVRHYPVRLFPGEASVEKILDVALCKGEWMVFVLVKAIVGLKALENLNIMDSAVQYFCGMEMEDWKKILGLQGTRRYITLI